MKKSTKAQTKLWSKAQLWKVLQGEDSPPTCINCRHRPNPTWWEFLDDTKKPKCYKGAMVYFCGIYHKNTLVLRNSPAKGRKKLKVPLCNRFFEKD
jgi:hypothetical protein